MFVQWVMKWNSCSKSIEIFRITVTVDLADIFVNFKVLSHLLANSLLSSFIRKSILLFTLIRDPDSDRPASIDPASERLALDL